MSSTTPTSKVLLDFEKRNPSLKKGTKIVLSEEEASRIQSQVRNSKKRQFGRGEERLSTNAVPRSDVLGKVKNFLGIMAEANQQLERSVQENPQMNYDIEAVTGNDREYIEMDLFLGVADLQTPEAVAAAEAAIGGSGQSIPSDGNNTSESDTDSCSDNDDDDDDDGADMSNRGPKIVVLK